MGKMKLSSIKLNPNNPRLIKDEKFKKLCKSIEEFPQMMELRPIIVDEEGVILGGNMRYQALQYLGYKELEDKWVMRASDLTEEQKKEFIVKDNVGFGEWDWDVLANEWDDLPLADWGLDVPMVEDLDPADLDFQDYALKGELNRHTFQMTFILPIEEKERFEAFDKKELEDLLRRHVNA